MKKPVKIIVIAALALVLVIAAVFAVWNLNGYRVTITPIGGPEMTHEVGSEFEDPGASAVVAGTILDRDPKSLEVQTSGRVDGNVLGSYTLTYTAKYSRPHFLGDKHASGSAPRKVQVVDTQLPQIQLLTKDGSFTLPGHAYEEEGFVATDNYDGDITAQVSRKETDGKVYYTVQDSSGNVGTAVREIFYDDPVPPELTLVGGETVDVVLGQTYTEAGFTALDNFDGDITAKVQVSGTVDTNTLGEYILSYSVTDTYGNNTTVNRKVKVMRLLPEVPNGVGGVIYLTFDDGPGEHTERLLDILDEYGAKATFFVVGRNDLTLTKRMVESGHSVGNHSFSHKYERIYASQSAFFGELYYTQDCIEKACGIKTRLVRFPGGSSNDTSQISMRGLANALTSKGYAYFDWNVDSKDAGGALTVEEVYYNVCTACSTRKTCVVLQHDIKGYSVEAVEYIIRWGLANGYRFEALTVSSPGMHHGTRN